MANVFEPAASGRAKCRGCSVAIARGELRFGERLPNPFGDGEMTIWFHPLCAAYKRPEPLLQALGEARVDVPDRERLERAARSQLAHRRLPRISGAERAPSSQAKCRACREPIGRGGWRIRLVFYEEGPFAPGGFIHFGTGDIAEPLLHFSAGLSDAEREELRRACGD
jgi:hypothetical protein